MLFLNLSPSEFFLFRVSRSIRRITYPLDFRLTRVVDFLFVEFLPVNHPIKTISFTRKNVFLTSTKGTVNSSKFHFFKLSCSILELESEYNFYSKTLEEN